MLEAESREYGEKPPPGLGGEERIAWRQKLKAEGRWCQAQEGAVESSRYTTVMCPKCKHMWQEGELGDNLASPRDLGLPSPATQNKINFLVHPLHIQASCASLSLNHFARCRSQETLHKPFSDSFGKVMFAGSLVQAFYWISWQRALCWRPIGVV